MTGFSRALDRAGQATGAAMLIGGAVIVLSSLVLAAWTGFSPPEGWPGFLRELQGNVGPQAPLALAFMLLAGVGTIPVACGLSIMLARQDDWPREPLSETE